MEVFDFIKTKSVYTSWSDNELFISVERKMEKGDDNYDEATACIKLKGCNDNYLIYPIPLFLGHQVGDKVVLSVELEGSHYTTIAVSKAQCDKLADMVDAVNAEFERS